MSQSTAVVDTAEIRRRMAEQMKAKIGSAGADKIKLTKQKEFVLPNGVKSKGPLTVVVVDFVAFNSFFDRPFSEANDKRTPPACFALAAVKPDQLVPSDRSPKKQDDGQGCHKCWANQFKSHANGVGKACRNHYRLGVVEANDDPNSTIYVLEPGPTSVRNWETYFGTLQLRGQLPVEVVTEVWFDANKDYQCLKFGNPKPNPNADLHTGRLADVSAKILVEPDVSSYEAPPQPKGRK